MFRGCSILNLDSKGRLAVPSRFRDRLQGNAESAMVLTLNPLDPCLLLYPLSGWVEVEEKLSQLPDFDVQGRRTKQMMQGHATDCSFDSAGRILIASLLRDYAELSKGVAFLGLGNKFALWNEDAWSRRRAQWVDEIRSQNSTVLSETMRALTL